MKLSFSKLKTYKDCARKYKFKYIDHISEPDTYELKLGSLGHKVLEDYYKTSERSQELISALCVRHGIQDDLDSVLKEILDGYHEWSEKEWRGLEVKEIEKEYNYKELTGKIDLIGVYEGQDVIIDHKFKGQWSPNILEQLLHDEQTKTYALMTGHRWVFYNLIRTKKAATRPKFEKVSVLVPQVEVNRIEEEYPMWSQRIEQDNAYLRNRGYNCMYCPFKDRCYNYDEQ